MDKLRLPFFVAALVLIAVVVLVEMGSALLLKGKTATADLQVELNKKENEGADRKEVSALNGQAPPGLGIPCMAFLDGLVAFTALLMGLPFLLSDRLQGRIVGITSVILAFALFKVLSKIGLGTEMTVLENNAMQSVASAAGYMTGGGTVAAIPAQFRLAIFLGHPIPFSLAMAADTLIEFFLLGVVLAWWHRPARPIS